MSEEQRYTLEEAKQALAAQECDRHGHSWEVQSNWAGEISFLYCSNECGEAPRFGKYFSQFLNQEKPS